MTIEMLFNHPLPMHYKHVVTTSHYLTMPNGVKIAMDVLLPKHLPNDEKLPTLMVMARYWRSMQLRIPSPPNKAPFVNIKPIPMCMAP
jgi:predicted acyl esterase